MADFTSEDTNKLSDQALITQFITTEDQRYFNELYGRFAHLVEAICIQYVENKQDSQELTQVIFEKVSKQINEAPIQDFANWLFVVTRNTCIDTIRSRRRKRRWLNSYSIEQRRPDLFRENEVNWQLRDAPLTQRIDLLPQAIEELSALQQQCIKLFFTEKNSYQEIADLLGITLSEVKSHLQNGKRRLKSILIKLQQEASK
ncbi:MAG: sigma-70 family RNA polymerase sigma factor [Bacteroidota bacterium]